MARFATSAADSILRIGKFLGVNECLDGDTNLEYGEASAMQNFKITDNYSLQVRPGSKNVAGLLSAYTITTATEVTTVATDINTATSTFTAYPTISVSDGGILTLSGTSVTVNYANHASYTGYYWQNPTTGLIYKLVDCVYTQPATGTHVTGGTVSYDEATSITFPVNPTTTYSDIAVSNGEVVFSGTSVTKTGVTASDSGRYWRNYDGYINKLTVTGDWIVFVDGSKVNYVGDDTYSWNFNAVKATTNSEDTVVRGIWSGYVGSVEYLVAACNSFLWSLTVTDGVWTKTNIGEIDTTNDTVHMFGFDKKLYIMDGTEYRVWDGSTLSTVTGYRPLIRIVADPATGSGTTLEQINKLNGLRRVRFSSTGGTTFQLPETGLSSIDYVKYVGTGAAITTASLNTTTGLITTSSATTAGTDNIEIGYTVSTTFRATVTAMRYSEIYNGETDTRVFIYGDGSNKALYSGIGHDGQPSAEYFPDLYEMTVDSANTPITSMIKHYDQLLTFKTNGAFITNYGGSKTLSDGNAMPTFYTSPLNRSIGNEAIGQAVLVNNNPFTLFGRSVYEWKMSSFANKDERNADVISGRVGQTLATFNPSSAICYDDNFHSEYYVIQNEKAVVFNYTANAWYIYSNIPATCMINYKQELYYGDKNGYIRHLSRDYLNDNGDKIQCYWESGSMDFGAPRKRKYSKGLWLGIKPEDNGFLSVTAITDKTMNLNEEESASENTESSVTGFFDFLALDFETLSFNVNTMPRIDAHKIRAKKFTYYKLILSSSSDNSTATVTDAEIAYRYTSNVR